MLSLIAGISQNNCIGQNGQLPWHIPEDLKHFREVTAGKTVHMGRKTWESLPAKFRPLPNRINIIITRQTDYSVPAGVEVYATIDEATAKHPNEEIMVIGGAEIYKQTIDRADQLYITHIAARERVIAVALATGANRASMLQDALAGRRTEIEAITGSLLALAERQGAELSTHRAVFALVRAIEAASRP